MSKSDFVNRESELEMLESKFESGEAALYSQFKCLRALSSAQQGHYLTGSSNLCAGQILISKIFSGYWSCSVFVIAGCKTAHAMPGIPSVRDPGEDTETPLLHDV